MPNDPAWINADGGAPEYNARELRRLDAALMYPGVADRFGARSGVRPGGLDAVSISGTTVTVQDLCAVVHTAAGGTQTGPYRVALQSEPHALDPADGSNPRIDAIDLQVQDDDEDASAQRRAHSVYVVGTPAGSPAAPALTANSLRLATVLVPAGGSPSPSLTYTAPFTVALGGVLPVRDDTERPATGLYYGMFAYRQDIDEMQVFDGSIWRGIGRPDPPRVASGTVTVAPGTQTANGHYALDLWEGSQGITFPTGLFNAGPRVMLTPRTSAAVRIVAVAASSVTSTGATVHLVTTNNTARSVDWVAVQTLDDQGF